MRGMTDGQFGFAIIDQDGVWQPAVATVDGVVPLEELLGGRAANPVPTTVRGLLADWDIWCDRVTEALDTGDVFWRREEDVTFGAPLPDPGNLYMAGANYYDHIAEMEAPLPDKSVEDAFHFMVPSGSLTGTPHDVYRPRGVRKLDWEVELAVVIGRTADRVPVEKALDVVAGYAVSNDVSVRDDSIFHPIFGVKFLFAKGQATLTPFGPVIVPGRFVNDPDSLSLSMHVNGKVRQNSSTAQMIWSVAEQIAGLSAQAPLHAGDIILSGTPAGTAAAFGSYLTDGDVMVATVEGLGVLTNRVVGSRP